MVSSFLVLRDIGMPQWGGPWKGNWGSQDRRWERKRKWSGRLDDDAPSSKVPNTGPNTQRDNVKACCMNLRGLPEGTTEDTIRNLYPDFKVVTPTSIRESHTFVHLCFCTVPASFAEVLQMCIGA